MLSSFALPFLSLFVFFFFLTSGLSARDKTERASSFQRESQPCSSSEIRLDGSSRGSVLECLRLGFVEM